MRCFLAFFTCLRWENASISAIHLMRLFPRNFKWLPLDYRANNGIYSYIHRCFTPITIWTFIDMFWGICLFHYFVRTSLRNIWCSPVRKTISEYLKTRHYSCIFLTFSDKRIQIFPVVFESANWIIRSIIQQFFLTVNSTKTIVFLVLRIRCQVGKWFEFVAYWCFPVAKDCFERKFSVEDRAFPSIF